MQVLCHLISQLSFQNSQRLRVWVKGYALGCQVARGAVVGTEMKSIPAIGLVTKEERQQEPPLCGVYQQPWEAFSNHAPSEKEIEEYKAMLEKTSQESVATCGDCCRQPYIGVNKLCLSPRRPCAELADT